jgi:WD40 repeat protein
VVARDDGSQARVVTRGLRALLAPNGRRVLVAARRRSGDWPDLRLVSARGGRARVLMRNAEFEPGDEGPLPAWAPNSRHVVAGNANNGIAFLFDVRRRRRRDLDRGFYAGGSFSPDSSRLALALGDARSQYPAVFLYGMRSRKTRLGFRRGNFVKWGRRGLAYAGPKGLMVRARPRGRSRLLFRHPPRASVQPVDWSADGRWILAAVKRSSARTLAVLIKKSSGERRTLPTAFAEVSDLSRSGKRVLGVVDGNVVSVHRSGTLRVLARSADSPSWNS